MDIRLDCGRLTRCPDRPQGKWNFPPEYGDGSRYTTRQAARNDLFQFIEDSPSTTAALGVGLVMVLQ
jgi:hypothetical protein